MQKTPSLDFDRLRASLEAVGDTTRAAGKVCNIVGMMMEVSGVETNVGEICRIRNQSQDAGILAETVGFKNGHILLMPYGDLQGVGLGSLVEPSGHRLRVPVGDFLVGRVVDAVGNPMDGGEEFRPTGYREVDGGYLNPLARPRIREVVPFGIRAVDGVLTVGKGQRMGIFAGSGVGKSTLMGMIARNIQTDVNVIALVGERGREVSEFIEKDLGPEGLARSVLVVATSDQPPMYRVKCAKTATAIAEYFRDQGRDVLLMMDSLTRFAMAQRDVGLAVGEPPIARGYTSSIYAELPRLLERCGNYGSGSITGVYTVLVEGDDTNEPISDTVRGILDGHIVLSRALAHRNHYPAIDINGSISRLMNDIVSDEHRAAASRLRDALAVYQQNADLVAIGAYKQGTNPRLDDALRRLDAINAFLCQKVEDHFDFDETVRQLGAL